MGNVPKKYLDFLEALPDEMINKIIKSPLCKRLLDPTACNSKCSMGYIFKLKGVEYQKCKFNSFMFRINDNSIDYIQTFIEKEYAARVSI